MKKTAPLMDIVNAAAARFDSRPLHRASIEARAELRQLTPEVIDRYFAEAAVTIKEVEQQLQSSFRTPASLHGVKIR